MENSNTGFLLRFVEKKNKNKTVFHPKNTANLEISNMCTAPNNLVLRLHAGCPLESAIIRRGIFPFQTICFFLFRPIGPNHLFFRFKRLVQTICFLALADWSKLCFYWYQRLFVHFHPALCTIGFLFETKIPFLGKKVC